MADNKNRILYFRTILERRTDPEHQMTMEDIRSALVGAGYKYVYDTVRSDLKALQENGLDIQESTAVNGVKHYCVASRAMSYEAAELMVSTIAANKGFDALMKEKLAESICELFSDFQADRLRESMRKIDAGCFGNLQVGYLSLLSTAIRQGIKCVFQYRRSLPGGKFEYRKGGEFYTLSPYSLHITNGSYYVRGYCDNDNAMRNFRLDRMDNLALPEKERLAVPCPEDYDPALYERQVFYMYDAGIRQVKLDCDSGTMDAIRDHFGDRLPIRYGENGTFSFTCRVGVSPAFFGWLCMFRGRIRLTWPKTVQEEFQAFISECGKITE